MPKLAATSSAAAGRGGRGRRVATSLAEINVVPLVDVMLVLLIIFMVTAPMLQRGIDVKLPVSRRAAQIPATTQRVEISIPKDYGQQQVLYINKDSVPVRAFQERVRQQMEHRDNKEVFLRGDGTVTYQELMQVIDMLKGAGVTNIGMVARMPGEQ